MAFDLDDEELKATRILNRVDKTADKMFEELGYKKKYHIVEDEVILIGYTQFDEPVDECQIMFLKKIKRLMTMNWITINELQAINKKCEELGWKE